MEEILDEEMIKRLEEIDEAIEKNPIEFAKYCHNKFGIRYFNPKRMLDYCKQLQENFGAVTDNMLDALQIYEKLFENNAWKN